MTYIKEIVPQEQEKKKIERALKCFVPELIGRGYSGEYIYHYVRKIFFERPVDSIEVLNVFLDRFDFKRKEYTVYVPIKNRCLISRRY